MTIQIDVQNLQKQILLRPSQIISTAEKILHHERVSNAQLSVVFVTDQRMKFLNKTYLHHAYTTDVLAFDFLDPTKKRLPLRDVNGEIVISTGAVCRQAKIFNTTLKRELLLYVIHGILHLLGFDDHRPCDITRMRRKEEQLMELIKTK